MVHLPGAWLKHFDVELVQGEGLVLFGHCCGAIRQLPVLTIISTARTSTDLQVSLIRFLVPLHHCLLLRSSLILYWIYLD